MTKAKLNRWVKALRSKKFKQAKHALTNGEGHCCMGVLCELEGLPRKNTSRTTDFDFSYKFPIKEAGRFYQGATPPSGWLGLTNIEIDDLSELNDNKGWSFTAIATWIKKNIKPTTR